MKKLMIAVAVVCAAALSQAASVAWTATAVKTSDSTDDAKVNASGYAAFAFFSAVPAGSSQGTLDKVWTLALAEEALTKAGGADLSAFNVTSGKAVGTALTDSGALNISTPFEDAKWGTGDTTTSFMIIFNNSDIKKADKYLVAVRADDSNNPLVTTAAFGDPQDGKTAAFGTQKNNLNWKTISTSDVPEPTSAMLLLLGVAGLALRRRRA